jgi:NAD(P)-dependent dehydrogenase (short-subunit alcohol dehydrogenase family)
VVAGASRSGAITRSTADVDAVFARIRSDHGRLDVLVNPAPFRMPAAT